MTSVETIRQSTRNAMAELLDLAKVREGQLFVEVITFSIANYDAREIFN
ncbi:MAG: hypothetical protein Q619_VDC00400G0001, partial [Veillonella dispar DORA_11]